VTVTLAVADVLGDAPKLRDAVGIPVAVVDAEAP
jgi:hypothetical protein